MASGPYAGIMTAEPGADRRDAIIARGSRTYRRAMNADWPEGRAGRTIGLIAYALYEALKQNAVAEAAEMTTELVRVLPAAGEGETG